MLTNLDLAKRALEQAVVVAAKVPLDCRVAWRLVPGPLVGLHQGEEEGTNPGPHIHPNVFCPVVDNTVMLVQEDAGQRERCCATAEVENIALSANTPVCVCVFVFVFYDLFLVCVFLFFFNFDNKL